MLAFFALSLTIGATCGVGLAYLLAAKQARLSAGKQWAVYTVVVAFVLVLAAIIGAISNEKRPDEWVKLTSALLVAGSFFAAYGLSR